MSLIPWTRRNPPERLSSVPDFDEMVSSMLRGLPLGGINGGAWAPAIDVKDDEKHVTVTAEVPGVRKEDIKIEVNGRLLTLRGEKKEEKTETKDNWWRRETLQGTFLRQVTMPTEVDAEHTEAKLDKGVLTVRLPKTATGKAKTIKVG